MPFDPKRQVRANLERSDVDRLAEAARRLGWPEGEQGASVAGLVRRVCSDWLARAEGVPADSPGSHLPSLAELAARLARVERRLDLGASGLPPGIAGESRAALPAPEVAPSGSRRDSLAGMPSKPEPFTPSDLAAAMKAKGLSALALSEALGRKDRGRAVARWLNGSAKVPAVHHAALAKLLG